MKIKDKFDECKIEEIMLKSNNKRDQHKSEIDEKIDDCKTERLIMLRKK